jgi:hypothetical protein
MANHVVPFWYLHPRCSETVAAAVVAQRGHRLDEIALIAACRAELARYRCPTSVRLLDELPRNATGKVLPTPLVPRPRYRRRWVVDARARILDELTQPDTSGFGLDFGDQPFGRVARQRDGHFCWVPLPSTEIMPASQR